MSGIGGISHFFRTLRIRWALEPIRQTTITPAPIFNIREIQFISQFVTKSLQVKQNVDLLELWV